MLTAIVLWLVVGLIAGFLASVVMRGGGSAGSGGSEDGTGHA